MASSIVAVRQKATQQVTCLHCEIIGHRLDRANSAMSIEDCQSQCSPLIIQYQTNVPVVSVEKVCGLIVLNVSNLQLQLIPV